ncbi:hypothetical protein LTR53_009825 [Teratosphaeriaceae sp. CCFEE 6253]|nr:hypothetical protein LTR53_009825 [Teratosphaeriaceae sp. CCFEE 6253]
MAVTTVPSDPASPACFWWKLPRELRDMIYSLAYSQSRKIKVMLRRGWLSRETRRRRRDRCDQSKVKPHIFPSSIVEALLVSKEYFDEALPQFFGDTTILLSTWQNLQNMAYPGGWVEKHLLANIRSIDIDGNIYVDESHIESLTAFPRLAILGMTLGYSYFSTLGEDGECHSDHDIDLDDAKILQNPNTQAFTQIRGLRRIEIAKLEWTHDLTAEGVAALGRNYDRAATIIRQQVMREHVLDPLASYPVGIADALEMTKRDARPQEACKPAGLGTEAQQRALEPLEDAEVPETGNEFVQLFLSRPNDVLAWTKDMKARFASASSGGQDEEASRATRVPR